MAKARFASCAGSQHTSLSTEHRLCLERVCWRSVLGTDDCGIDRVCMPCVQGAQAQEAVVSLTLAVSVWKADPGHTKWLLSHALFPDVAERSTNQCFVASQEMTTCKHLHREAKRKRLAMLFGLEGAVQWLNLVFYVIPNIWLLFKPCYYFSPVITICAWVRWSCWNTVITVQLPHNYLIRYICH